MTVNNTLASSSNIRLGATLASTCLVALTLAACGVDPVSPENEAPVVTSVIAGPQAIYLGDACTVTCTATDADGDPLTFEWAGAQGRVDGQGSEVSYTPTSCCLGGNPVIVIVRDGRGGETRAETFVAVTP
jgi:hypothetical protein